MDQNKRHRNRPTQIQAIGFFSNALRQFNTKRIVFSTNGGRTIGYS